ncbi:MAG TPA: DegQ family serine endoprotease [Myxococcota bacterium]|nr:DegQ family serine endoprotease [Myxococcota bacterium]
MSKASRHLRLLCCALALAALSAAPVTARNARAEISKPFWTEGEPGDASGRPDSFADLADKVSPAVVNIKVERKTTMKGGPEELFEEFFGQQRKPGQPGEKHAPHQFRVPSTGSGFVVSADGLIVTNNHVVENADKVVAVFQDGTEKDAKIIGRDPKTDLALIKVSAEKPLAIVPLGDSEHLRVGSWVMAIGNPFGLDHTVTVGILSAKGRSNFGGEQIAGPYDDFLQTDASINPGNSGGPLCDMKGRVIGINTAIAANGQGIGFAIPINMVKSLLPQLLEHGSVTRGWLGVQIQRVTPSLAKTFKLTDQHGALVGQVFDDSPASKAKLERGDVITKFDGRDIREYDDLPRIVASTPPGSAVDVTILRDGKEKKLKATLEKMKEEEIQPASDEQTDSDWGFEVQPLSDEIASQLGLSAGAKGVVVASVDPDSAAARAGLRRGDVILEANRQEIGSAKQLKDALGKNTESAVLLVQRGDGTLYLAIDKDS